MAAALSLRDRYERLWAEIDRAEPIGPGERYRVDARLRRLNALGFVVEEVIVEPGGPDGSQARLRVAVGSRRFHAARLQDLTGLVAGEGQATVLLNDLASWAGFSAGAESFEPASLGARPDRAPAARRPTLADGGVRADRRPAARASSVADVDPVQAYCDYIEVKWLLSEQAGHDVGDDSAIRSIAEQAVPVGAAAGMAVAEESSSLYEQLYAGP